MYMEGVRNMYQKTTLKWKTQLICFLLALAAWIAAIVGIAASVQGNASFSVLTVIEITLLAVSAVLLALLLLMTGRGLFTPLMECAERISALAAGDLDSPMPECEKGGEIGELIRCTGKLTDTLRQIIEDEDRILTAMSKGDFTVSSDCRDLYADGFQPLLTSMQRLCYHLGSSLQQISSAASQVDTASTQVSDGAQALSQGATQQASSVQELAATINDISTQITESAGNAGTASSLANSVGNDMMDSNLHMSEMTNAMAEIKEASKQIHKIIKTIEDIAFQTNILALNAAVEAARAGSAGKGFAVVADEVRNLAGKSQNAAKDTAVMIQNAIAAVDKGITIADETAESMNKVVANAQMVVDQISSISETSKTQADAVSQVTTGIDQISSVIQTNSATAEESAAASQQMSAQAVLLHKIVSGFKFRSDQELNRLAASLREAGESVPAQRSVASSPVQTEKGAETISETTDTFEDMTSPELVSDKPVSRPAAFNGSFVGSNDKY